MKLKSVLLFLILLLIAPQSIAARSRAGRYTAARLELSIASTPSPAAFPPLTQRTKFEPLLLKRLIEASDREMIRGIVWMDEQTDLSPTGWPTATWPAELSSTERLARRQAVIDRLQETADRSQRQLRALLQEAVKDGRVSSYKPLWIVNAIAVHGTRQAFGELAARPEVRIIRQDRVLRLPDRDPVHAGADRSVAGLSGGVQWNLQRIQADRVWEALGITGKGIVVANLDSGVDWQHPDLLTRYRGYTGKPFPTHAGNWYCATDEGYAYPGDGLGHGTHTMGTMVGQNGVGVAPDAQWIAVKVFTNTGIALESWIHDGFQWILAPEGDPSLAPDIVNNSWGNSIGASETYLPDVQALRAAGILPLFSAGNDGPTSETIWSPASLHESLAVGATDEHDLVAFFSSRGPSPWGELKPEISAPGVDILSTVPGGAWETRNGTSMAAPHVAGVIALMRQANPALTNDEIERILVETAIPLGEATPNNSYGWGLVNAYAAVTHAGHFGRLEGRVTDATNAALVTDAAVQALSHGQQVRATTTTDAFGRYALGLSAGHWDATFTAFGYQAHTTYSLEMTTGITISLDAALSPLPTGTLQGRIRESETQAPLHASLHVPGAPPTTTTHMPGGTYSMVLPQGTHVVRAEAADHRFVTTTVTIAAGETTVQDLSLEPAPSILLVDSGAWYNHSQRAFYQSALESLRYRYDLHVVAEVLPRPGITSTHVPTVSDLLPYDIVIWTAPQDAPGYIGAGGALTGYLDRGGRLLLSGQDIAFWDGGGNLSHAPYFRTHLKARYVSDSASSRTLLGQAAPFAGMAITIAGSGGADNQAYPDVIAATDPDYATSTWTYQENGSGGQTVGHCLPYRVIYLAFGLEGVNDGATRQEMVGRSVQWLAAPPQEAGLELHIDNAPPGVAPAGIIPQIARPGERVTHMVRLRNKSETSEDMYALNLDGYTWPITPNLPFTLSVGSCQSTTARVYVDIPAGIGWHVYDTSTLSARSTLSPNLQASVNLVSKTPAPALLVDGARFYRVEKHYQAALDETGVAYDYFRVKDVESSTIPTSDTLAMYPMVLWYTAYDWYEPLSTGEESALIAYLESNGRLFLSSQDYLYYGHDRPLARNYLGVLNYTEDLSSTIASGRVSHPIGWGLGPYTLTYPYLNMSDALRPVESAEIAFYGQHARPIALSHWGKGWRTVFLAFPFETLAEDAAAQVMARTVGHLSWLGSSTWGADQRTVSSGSQVTMTGVLRNDGDEDIATARLTATLPGELSLVAGSLAPGASYHPATRQVTWAGELARDAETTIDFRVQVADSLSDSTYVSLPAEVGYDEHTLSFTLPYILRVNGPDLASSSLVIEPATGSPSGTLTCTLTVRNTGIRDTWVTITSTPPIHAVFTGTLHDEGIGSGEMQSHTLSWNGPVDSKGQVSLHYHLALDGAGDRWLTHQAHVRDQYDEYWPVEAQAYISFWQAWLPVISRDAAPSHATSSHPERRTEP